MKRTVLALLAAALALPARAGTLEQASARQKNGLWELSGPGMEKPLLFCVTDAEKLEAVTLTQDALAGLGCKPVKDAVSGERFELRYACASPNPQVGKFEMFVDGTSRPDRFESRTRIVGGGELMQHIAASLTGASRGRWVRPCKATEKPGLQK